MSNKNLVNYVKKKNKLLSEHRFGSLQVIIKDHIKNDVDLEYVFNKFNNIIPDHFTDLIDIIYVGHFDFFDKKNINALFLDGAIYVSNDQDDNNDLLDDLVHELAHAVENKYGDFIYSDGVIEDEFLSKREKLRKILRDRDYDTNRYNFYKTEYDDQFDLFLYDEVGYDSLRLLSVDLFVNSYAPTSLREYFASGFEEFYLGDKLYLRDISNYIYKKLMILHEG